MIIPAIGATYKQAMYEGSCRAMSLTLSQLNQLRRSLQDRKKELKQQIAHSDNDGLQHSMRDSIGELSLYDNHPGDLGTELYERGKDVALNERAEHQLEEIRNALENIATGTYGVCLTCGIEIPFERMEAIPWTTYCVRHSPNQDTSDRRPAEEEFLQPPFGRTSLDERDDNTQFDGEDAWQAVEKFGNSNTPAMAEDPNDFDYYDPYIEADENSGYVESIESFLATDLYGEAKMVIRNGEYRRYMESQEGDRLLEPASPASSRKPRR